MMSCVPGKGRQSLGGFDLILFVLPLACKRSQAPHPVPLVLAPHFVPRRRPSEPFESPEKFHSKATQDIGRWNECVTRDGELACLKRYEPQQLIKGMYAGFVEVSGSRSSQRVGSCSSGTYLKWMH